MATIQLPVQSPLISAGDFTANVLDPFSGTPTNVIRKEDAWAVHAEWYLEGPIVAILNGRWRLQVALESIGNQGTEMVAPAVLVDYSAGILSGTYPNQRMSFHAHVNFPAGTPPTGGAPDVVYHCSAMLTYLTPAGTPGPFAAVIDLGLIQVFDSPKP
jgi:hypothetical protein